MRHGLAEYTVKEWKDIKPSHVLTPYLILQQSLNEGGPCLIHFPLLPNSSRFCHFLLSLFYLGKLQTSRWMFRAVGPHQCSAAQKTPT